MKDLMLILIQDPEMVHSRVLIGKTLKLAGDLDRAEEQMEHVIRLESDLYSHHAELGDIRFLMRNKSKLKLAVKGVWIFFCQTIEYQNFILQNIFVVVILHYTSYHS